MSLPILTAVETYLTELRKRSLGLVSKGFHKTCPVSFTGFMELNNASIESKPTQALAEAMILNRREEKRRSKSFERNEKQALSEGFDHKSGDEH